MLAFDVAAAGVPAADPDPSPPIGDLCSEAARDFGGIVHAFPAAVIRPLTADDVSRAVALSARSDRLTVAARGNGHSVSGQAMAENGLVLDMRSIGPGMELVRGAGEVYADVPGGALWEEVLHWSVNNYGLSPVSWTDYLRLTVGGTLSNAGISGQAYRRGPQISNVAQMEVVTGDGELHVCSPETEPDLFFAVLGGLGQFGVITRARIPLAPAPPMVRCVRLVYADFAAYSSDAEALVSSTAPVFDYVEGFAFVNSDDPVQGRPSVPLPRGGRFDSSKIPAGAGPLLYCLEAVLYLAGGREDDGHDVDEMLAAALEPLKFIRGLKFVADMGYVEFLSRVNEAESAARSNGSWATPHPWLNIFISAADIADFEQKVFQRMLAGGVGGPMLVYPLRKSQWNTRTSVALPDSEIFYLVALLRFVQPYPQGQTSAASLVEENSAIIEHCRSSGYDYKVYFPHYETAEDWARHFGEEEGWLCFRRRKERYDPLAILSPGQNIFPRFRPVPRIPIDR